MAPLQLTTNLTCTAEGLKWLWAMRGAIERIMIGQCKVVAETFVDFCGRACREGLEPVGGGAQEVKSICHTVQSCT